MEKNEHSTQPGINNTESEARENLNKNKIISFLRDGSPGSATERLEVFPLPESFLQSEEVQNAAKSSFIFALTNGYAKDVTELLKAFPLPESILQSEEVQNAAKTGFLQLLGGGHVNEILELLETSLFPESVLQSDEVQNVAKTRLVDQLSRGDISFAAELLRISPFADSFIQSKEIHDATKARLIWCLKFGDLKSITTLLEAFSLPESVIQSEEVQNLAERNLVSLLMKFDIQGATLFLNAFPLPETVVHNAVKEKLIRIINNNSLSFVTELLEAFPLPESVLQSEEVQNAAKNRLLYCLKLGEISNANEFLKTFQFPNFVLQSEEAQNAAKIGIRQALKNNKIEFAIELTIIFKLPDLRALERTMRIFGTSAGTSSFYAVSDLNNGKISREVAELGIEKTGETGLLQLERKMRRIRHEFLFTNIDPKQELFNQLQNSIVGDSIKGLVRYTSSEWGKHDQNSFSDLLLNYKKAIEKGAKELDSTFVPSQILQIETLEDLSADFTYSKGFLDRFAVLAKELQAAQRLVKENEEGGFAKELLIEVAQLAEKELEKIRERIAYYKEVQVNPEKAVDKKDIKSAPFAIKNLETQQARLKELQISQTTFSMQELFSRVAEIPGADSQLRKMIFGLSFHLNDAHYRNQSFAPANPEAPSEAEATAILNFVDHITNQETFAQYFTDEKTKKQFQSITSTIAIQEEVRRMNGTRESSGKTRDYVFIPSRDFKTELSGHMSDACWANKYPSMIQALPNFTFLTFVENPGNEKYERITGGTFLIQTKARDGTPLLVIRGLNPIENVANALNLKDFVVKLKAYLEPIAKEQGRRLAIVIDDHSGGSATNRPALFAYLTELKKTLKQAPLASNEETIFNEYNITECTYYI